jgi:hypothetical protein
MSSALARASMAKTSSKVFAVNGCKRRPWRSDSISLELSAGENQPLALFTKMSTEPKAHSAASNSIRGTPGSVRSASIA